MNQKLQNGPEWMNNHPAGDGSNLKYLWGLVSLPYAIRMGITAVISYPLETMTAVGIADNAYLGGLAPANPTEGIGFVSNFFGITEAVK
ncbi:MAG: hypothetical protein ABXS91_05610 [Sulfurimonas sp.]